MTLSPVSCSECWI